MRLLVLLRTITSIPYPAKFISRKNLIAYFVPQMTLPLEKPQLFPLFAMWSAITNLPSDVLSVFIIPFLGVHDLVNIDSAVLIHNDRQNVRQILFSRSPITLSENTACMLSKKLLNTRNRALEWLFHRSFVVKNIRCRNDNAMGMAMLKSHTHLVSGGLCIEFISFYGDFDEIYCKVLKKAEILEVANCNVPEVLLSCRNLKKIVVLSESKWPGQEESVENKSLVNVSNLLAANSDTLESLDVQCGSAPLHQIITADHDLPALKHLHLVYGNNTINWPVDLSRCCTRLLSLRLGPAFDPLNPASRFSTFAHPRLSAGLTALVARNPGLTEIVLNFPLQENAVALALATHCPLLRTFSAPYLNKSRETMHAFAVHGIALETLHAVWDCQLTNSTKPSSYGQHISNFTQLFAHMRDFYVVLRLDIDFSSLALALRCMPLLRRFVCEEYVVVTAVVVVALVDTCTQLEEVQFICDEEVTEEQLCALVQGSPRLKRLHLTCSTKDSETQVQNGQVTDRFLVSLAVHCTGLAQLRLVGHCVHATDVGLVALAAGCTALEQLTIKTRMLASHASDKALVTIGLHCRRLKALILMLAPCSFTQESILRLVQGCPKLHCVYHSSEGISPAFTRRMKAEYNVDVMVDNHCRNRSSSSSGRESPTVAVSQEPPLLLENAGVQGSMELTDGRNTSAMSHGASRLSSNDASGNGFSSKCECCVVQ